MSVAGPTPVPLGIAVPGLETLDGGPSAELVLVIDNYDSFTYNLAQALWELGRSVVVVRNDRITLAQVRALAPAHILLSPGPGRPEGAGICVELVRTLGGEVPILGVCLGHQAIAVAHGACVVRASRPRHGKTSPMAHDGRGIFRASASPMVAARYHSLVVDEGSLPDCLEVSARSIDDGEVMGIRYVGADWRAPLEGVQFHPESFLTQAGTELLATFLDPSTAKRVQ